jgi:hypothetical protein
MQRKKKVDITTEKSEEEKRIFGATDKRRCHVFIPPLEKGLRGFCGSTTCRAQENDSTAESTEEEQERKRNLLFATDSHG